MVWPERLRFTAIEADTAKEHDLLSELLNGEVNGKTANNFSAPVGTDTKGIAVPLGIQRVVTPFVFAPLSRRPKGPRRSRMAITTRNNTRPAIPNTNLKAVHFITATRAGFH
jgi:hypothetical protein